MLADIREATNLAFAIATRYLDMPVVDMANLHDFFRDGFVSGAELYQARTLAAEETLEELK